MAAGTKYIASHRELRLRPYHCSCIRKLLLLSTHARRSAKTMKELSKWRHKSRSFMPVNLLQTDLQLQDLCVRALKKGSIACPCCWLAACLYNMLEVPVSAVCGSDGGSSVFCKRNGQRSCWWLDVLELACRYLAGTGAPQKPCPMCG